MADRAHAYAHPLRERVLVEYQRGPASASEIARRLGRPLNLISYHTRVLVRDGYVELVRTELRRGGRTRYYEAIAAPFIDDHAWPRLSVARRRELVLSTLGRLADEAREAVHVDAFDAAHAHLSRSPVELDLEGRIAVGALLRDTCERIARIAAASQSAERRSHRVAMLAFEARADVSPSDARSGPADP